MAEDLWDSQQPLSNAQFRQLLETPLHKRKAAVGERRQKGAQDGAKKLKQTPVKEEEQEEDSPVPEELKKAAAELEPRFDRPLYRDRARERREGKSVEDASMTGLELNSGLADSEGMLVDAKEMSFEESKFLGGDLEHTHLVKGLDYALLNKERARILKSEAEAVQQQEQNEKQKRSKRGTTFASPMGRAVYGCLFKPSKIDARGSFKPGRTAFLYNLEDDCATDYRPTVLRRPKAECSHEGEHVMANVDTNVVQMLAKIISYMSASSSDKPHKKAKKKEKLELLQTILGPSQVETKTTAPEQNQQKLLPAEVKAPPPPEDDIFADVGTNYKPDLTRKKKKKTEPPSKPSLQTNDIAPSTDRLQTEKEEGRGREEGDDRDLLKVDKKTEKDIDPTSLPDHYAECYPGFHQSYSAAVVDSDDEDFSQMDTRGKNSSKYSFETDEEWSKYKQSMEQLPKAAFQYGVKMTDGRKTHSKLVDKHRKEQKLGNQLNKIEKLLKDQGHGHDTAFRSEKKSETPKEDESQAVPPNPKNRKRIRLVDD